MKFLLNIFITIALFDAINGLTESEEIELTNKINLIWPPDEIDSKVDIPNKSGESDSINIPPKNESVTCKCVSRHLCKNVTSCTNDCGVIDIRDSDGYCKDYLTTCCEDSDILTEPVPIPIETLRAKGCGVRNSNGIGFRIIGDEDNEAQFGEFPWMVAILQEENYDLHVPKLLLYQCGGSLIHPQVVLTSTHCVLSEDVKYYIRAGEWDTQTKNEILPHQDRIAVNIITHPKYNSGALTNDIALLILETPFDMSGNVQTVCLPPAGEILQNTRCFASGWGRDSYEREGQYQVILKKINLPIIQNDLCQEQLRQTRLGQRFTLHKSFICAGGEKGIDTCTGDGGSPLVCPIPGNPRRYYQGGIVAWGVECGLENVPGLYANVPLFRDWVDEKMIELGYGTSSYTY